MKSFYFVKLVYFFVLYFFFDSIGFGNSVVSNVRAVQRFGTSIVDIWYDLDDSSDGYWISLSVLDNEGGFYSLDATTVSGDVGNVTGGDEKHVIWDFHEKDYDLNFDTLQFKIEFYNFSDVLPMATIPSGTFQMGDVFDDGSPNEKPLQTVQLDSYKLGITELTLSDWKFVRDWAVENGYNDLVVGWGKDSTHPVHSVNWWDAIKWCNAASEYVGLEPVYYKNDGTVYRNDLQFWVGGSWPLEPTVPIIDYSKNGYRLPTEAEWERAARGGLAMLRFPASNTINHGIANYRVYVNHPDYEYDDTNYTSDTYHPDYEYGEYPYTAPAISFDPNGFGLYNMAGNVFEWCGDWLGAYSNDSIVINPTGPVNGSTQSNRIIRGGGWSGNADQARVSQRSYVGPKLRNNAIGIRVARSLDSGGLIPSNLSSEGSAISNAISVDTQNWNISSGVLENGSIVGLGTYLAGSTVNLLAVPDPGYAFTSWDISLLNSLADVPVQLISKVSLLEYAGDYYYVLNGIPYYLPQRRFILDDGDYFLEDVPESAPIAILNSGVEEKFIYDVIDSDPIQIYVSGGSTLSPYYNFYDSDGNDITEKFTSGYSIMRGRTYRFIASGVNPSYPFMINSSRFYDQETWVSGEALVGVEGILQIKTPKDYLGTLQFYCPISININGYLNLSIIISDSSVYDAYWGNVSIGVNGDFGSLDVVSPNGKVAVGADLFSYRKGALDIANSNPLTVFVDGSKTVSAVFNRDTSDIDEDGLTAYEEMAIYGTNPTSNDSDNDSHSDFMEIVNFNSDPLDPNSVPEYLLSVITSNYATLTQELVLGSIRTVTSRDESTESEIMVEINTSATLTAIPAPGFVFSGWWGVVDKTANPVSITMDGPKVMGADFLSVEMYNRIQENIYEIGEAAGLSEGYTVGFNDGFSQGESAVLADPLAYNLSELGKIASGLRLGGVYIRGSSEVKLLSFNIESSNDLLSWRVEEKVLRTLIMPDEGPLFVRVSAPVDSLIDTVPIPAGSFVMGDTLDRMSNAPPKITDVSAFYIGVTEVTWEQWQLVRDWAVLNGYSDLASTGKGKANDHPVYDVSWHDAVKWCNALSQIDGFDPVYLVDVNGDVYKEGLINPFIDYQKNGYRLPTEAEWEKAARGGLESQRYPFGNGINRSLANFRYSSSYHPDYNDGIFPYTAPVASFSPNGFGLFDVSGNVFEWCNDWYLDEYYEISPYLDPVGPDAGSGRVFRGGDFRSDADDCRVANRLRYNSSSFYKGFRVVRKHQVTDKP